jgi:hypothetical protein
MTQTLKKLIQTNQNIYDLTFGGQLTIAPELSKQEISFLEDFIKYKSFMVNTKGQLVFGMADEEKMFDDIKSFPMSIHPNKIAFDSQASGGLFDDETHMGDVLDHKCFNDLAHWISILTDFVFKPNSYFKSQFGEHLSFLKDHTLNGEILGYQREKEEIFHLEVKDNKLYHQDCFLNTDNERDMEEPIYTNIINDFYWDDEIELTQVYNELTGHYKDIIIETQKNILLNNTANKKPLKKKKTL